MARAAAALAVTIAVLLLGAAGTSTRVVDLVQGGGRLPQPAAEQSVHPRGNFSSASLPPRRRTPGPSVRAQRAEAAAAYLALERTELGPVASKAIYGEPDAALRRGRRGR